MINHTQTILWLMGDTILILEFLLHILLIQRKMYFSIVFFFFCCCFFVVFFFVKVFFDCYVTGPRSVLGHCRGSSLTKPLLITAFNPLISKYPLVSRLVWVSKPVLASSEIWTGNVPVSPLNLLSYYLYIS